ncbi:hypothetical protein [Comamonas sp. JC664]|uniref:hypothetical protein n=1 Tax=Comamonas sp. JC664 TaxID=2801917 RepID=UPI00174A429C|nr:hypothetical protein [Comamonas sp. JC664]MBL0698933.1 hypothetical protein [Comamonas sp. JC664]GHG79629.1 hypothetical protein GCM10012319_31680 [Comamonas sp. KCTC 72670]
MPTPYLALSGIPIPVSDRSALRYAPTLLGEKARTFSGFPRSSVRRKLLNLDGGTGPMPLAEAALMRALIDGEGDSWAFDGDAASSRGLWPSVIGAPTMQPELGRYEGGALALGLGSSITWHTQLEESWTAAYWARVWGVDGILWRHYVQRSDGTVRVNTVAPSPASGQTWDFDFDLLSNWGMAPSATTGDVLAGIGGLGLYGHCAALGEFATVTYPAQLGTSWTVAYWARRISSDATWSLYIHRPGVPCSRNGVLGNLNANGGALFASNGNYTQLPGGAVVLRNRTGSTGPGIPNPGGEALLLDDLVVLPYVVPDSWVAPWYASTAPTRLPGSRGLAAVDDNGSLTLQHVGGVTNGLTNPSNDAWLVDDLVVLPYLAPDAWLTPWRDAGAPFGPLPYHRATGTGLHRPCIVLGDAGQGEGMEWWEGPVRVAGESLNFTLMESP